MTYEEAIQKINSLLRFGVKPGLSRMRRLLAELGNPQDALRCVHVAGTNGKGSVCALLSAVLTQAGYRTGLFTSPYVSDFSERFQINGETIPHVELCALVEEVFPVVQSLEDQGITITEFEAITALAFVWFARRKCDAVVLEVGLGGRLDATNVIESPVVSVITSISLDHTAILGDSVEKIAWEKAGIVKPGRPVVCYAGQDPAAFRVLQETARERGSRLVQAPDTARVLDSGLHGTTFEYQGKELPLPFLGGHQIKNAETALVAVQVLREEGFSVPDKALQAGFSQARIPARLELLCESPVVLLDGAHNPEGTAALAAALRQLLPGRRLVALMGMLADKDVDTALANLKGLFSQVVTLAPQNPRALSAQALAEKWRPLGVAADAAETVEEALDRCFHFAGTDGAVVVGGSLYLAGDVRPALLQRLMSR